MKKFLAAATAACFILLPGGVEAAALTAPSPMAKPAKIPADAKPSAAKPAPAKPAVKPTAAKPAEVKPTNPPKPTKPVKPVKPAKPEKKSKKKDKNDKKDEKKKPVSGSIKIACKETAPFFPAKKVDDLVKTAKSCIGVKYVYGGATPKGFDCSGYIMYIFKKHGASVPRAADDQYDVGRKVADTKSLVKGDLVFFSEDRREITHVGLYLGSGQFIHASSSKGIRIDSISNEYWKPRYAGAKHLVK